ncbi:MAG: hypothetical protein CMN78_02010 [Spirochaetales bacterium]|nr:hypothetical protein [Spirochaetales bacterium]
MTFGVFGMGSEALGMDDELSRDHHWGVRIDALMPADVFNTKREEMLRVLDSHLPATFQGHEMGEGLVAGAGIAPDILPGFLARTIGIDHPPDTYEEWLSMPEEDVIHVINGEVWYDPVGEFTAIRRKLQNYYPEPVRLRRIAHWCRYFSGMGTYALKRAILRNNDLFAALAFGKALRWGIQLAFMIDKRYFPYDKWLLAFFKRLPSLFEKIGPIVDEAVRMTASWERKLYLLDKMSDILDSAMVKDGIIKPHPKFSGSESSGYRLLEHAYQEILKVLPQEIKTIIPQQEQIHMEKFVVGYVDGLDTESWHRLLNLTES